MHEWELDAAQDKDGDSGARAELQNTARKWGNKATADVRQQSPQNKRTKTACGGCGTAMVCSVCEPLKVASSFVQSNSDDHPPMEHTTFESTAVSLLSLPPTATPQKVDVYVQTSAVGVGVGAGLVRG